MIVLIVVISLSILIIVHELGHFLAAKGFKVKVEEFGFGFPPKIWGKQKGETTYSVNLLPFGGFVRIFGEDSTEPLGERSFTGQSIWRRSVMVLAGVFMNVVLGWLILSVVFMFGSPEHLLISDIQAGSLVKRSSSKAATLFLKRAI